MEDVLLTTDTNKVEAELVATEKGSKEKHLVAAAGSGPDLHDTTLLLHHQDNQLHRHRRALGILMQHSAYKTLEVKHSNRWVSQHCDGVERKNRKLVPTAAPPCQYGMKLNCRLPSLPKSQHY